MQVHLNRPARRFDIPQGLNDTADATLMGRTGHLLRMIIMLSHAGGIPALPMLDQSNRPPASRWPESAPDWQQRFMFRAGRVIALFILCHAASLAASVMAPLDSIGLQPLWSASAVQQFYAERENRPIWFDAEMPRPALFSLVQFLETLGDHGLDPDDYHATVLREGLESAPNIPLPERLRNQLEWWATDAFFALSVHLDTGRAYPGRPGLDAVLMNALPQLSVLLAVAVDHDQVASHLTPRPADPAIYAGLQAALVRLEGMPEFPVFPVGTASLRPGERDPRVAQLRECVAAWERFALPETPTAEISPDDPLIYDSGLVQRVMRFQTHMGLEDDGVVGPATLAMLNTPRTRRLDQLRANLERQRWPVLEEHGRLIRVNIPAFTLAALHDGQKVWQTRVIVGRQYRPTPLLEGKINTVVFNPTWTVPTRLVKEDLLPKIMADPNFLEDEGMTLYQRTAAGSIPIDRTELEEMIATGTRPSGLGIRQAPGKRNALGRVKFLFPNNEQIYLHDTPSRQLFNRARRMFSSGCIRVEDPLVLAEFVMGDEPGWTPERMEAIISAGKTRGIRVEPVAIQFVYWTVWADAQGNNVHFREDIYDEDAALARDLARTPWEEAT
ncbi:L,D-transpeptidase family protein [Candidatus Macondimonas diazotrophica]|jgi:murein L,D-transpeptidase YcbB/YkuD|uniref:L,D-TPase catalytic domain-containing protein n=1 Tax=Candidatus Macondimonas diazotrophica TaxID=2305248 RepID=A0A4Z0F5T2_9GAMM|nr:L,D-transpeptidase family protein [Candidatus Macondimonas diazotrophica]TFZ81538.1 hypothetical protein E4680_12000 [Candidatus Macondimonas diazotrophica]HBG52027.1 hypothetical protein [Gammaproteobacteria bacterium]